MERLQKFYFQAVDNDNHRISGSIFTQDEAAARLKLKKQGLALFSIELFDPSKAKTKDGFVRFDFIGNNKEGKGVRGKIEAINPYEAYKKLRKEYDFNITSIVDFTLSPEEKSAIIAKGISEEFINLYKEDSKLFKKKKKKAKKEVDVEEMTEKDKKELAFYHQEISLISTEIHELVARSENYLNHEQKRAILQRLGLIERLRHSNAVDHLKNLTHKLIDQIADDKLFMEEKIFSEKEVEEMDGLKNSFKEYSVNKKKSLTTKFMEVNIAFNVDPKKIALDISRTRPLTQIGFVLYWAVVSIFCLMTVLWIKNGITVIFNKGNIWESSFILKSLLLWLITALAFVNMMVFAPMIFTKKSYSTKKRIIFFTIALVANALVILFLPLLF